MNDLKESLIDLYHQQDALLIEKYDRSLSFQDGFFDRFERAKRLGFGEGASLYNSALIFGLVKVGIKSWIGPNVILDGSGGCIEIGDYCSISAGVHIYTHDTVMWALSGGVNEFHKEAVSIGSNTYIGAQSIIKAGVRIGTHCVIGANSFVNQDVEDYTIVGGSPIKTIGKVVLQNGEIFLDYVKL